MIGIVVITLSTKRKACQPIACVVYELVSSSYRLSTKLVVHVTTFNKRYLLEKLPTKTMKVADHLVSGRRLMTIMGWLKLVRPA